MSKTVCASTTGLIKVVNVKSKAVEAMYGVQAAGESISQLQLAPDSQFLFAARRSGSVTVTSMANGTTTNAIDFGCRDLVGLQLLDGSRILACTGAGIVKIADSEMNSIASTWKVADDVRAFASDVERFACGGNEQDLRIWDIQKQSVSFDAKNVPLDKLSLRQRVCISAIALHAADPHLIVTGTSYHQIRLYDTRRGRRPVVDVKVGENAVTAVTVAPAGNFNVFAGDGAGRLHQYELRRDLAVVGRYRGHTGSVRAISIHESGVMASVGLDRMLHVHDVKTRTHSARIYLKQSLTAVRWLPDSRDVAEHNGADDDDGLWNDLESVED